MNGEGLSHRRLGRGARSVFHSAGAVTSLLLCLGRKRRPPPPVPGAHPHVPSEMLPGPASGPPSNPAFHHQRASVESRFQSPWPSSWMLMTVRWVCSPYSLRDNLLHKLRFYPLHLLAQGQNSRLPGTYKAGSSRHGGDYRRGLEKKEEEL